MIKLLIVGNPNSLFIVNLAKWLKIANSNIEISIFNTTHDLTINNTAYFDHIINAYPKSIFNRIPLVRSYLYRLWLKNNFKKLDSKYDIVHIHYVTVNHLLLIHQLKQKAKKSIITIYGSDFYRAGKGNLNKLRRLFESVDVIQFTNTQTRDDFSAFYKSIPSAKYKIIRFGLEPLEYLKKLKSTKVESQLALKFNLNKIIVAVGYNANPGQQHVQIIKEILKFDKKTKDQICLVFPMTYGNKNKVEYSNEIKELLEESGFDYVIINKHMTDKEVAHLRNATDILIQLQISDQFSGSMQEHIYAENVVITGSWLPYKLFEKSGIYLRKIDVVNKIGQDLKYCLENFEAEQKKSRGNKDVIYELSSWPVNSKKWNNLYVDLIRDES